MFTVDWFAKFHTTKLPRFFSRFSNPGTSGIDFVAQSLESENCLVTVPSVHIVARAVHCLEDGESYHRGAILAFF